MMQKRERAIFSSAFFITRTFFSLSPWPPTPRSTPWWRGRGSRCGRWGGGTPLGPRLATHAGVGPTSPTPLPSPPFTQGAVLDARLSFAGRTLVASGGAVPPDTLFLSLPLSTLITAATLPADARYGAAWRALEAELAADGAGDDRDAVCLALLVEAAKGDASRFAPYVAALPTAYSDPTWWTDDEVALVRGTRLEASAAAARGAVERLAGLARKLAANAAASSSAPNPLLTHRDGWCVSVDGARWARSTVWSRAYNLPGTAATQNAPCAAALVPLADMLDHDPFAGVAWTLDRGEDGNDAAAAIALSSPSSPAAQPPSSAAAIAPPPSTPSSSPFFKMTTTTGVAHNGALFSN